MMQDRNYVAYAEHKADHEALLDQINDIMQDYEEGSYANQLERLSGELSAWFSTHFRDKDALLHLALKP